MCFYSIKLLTHILTKWPRPYNGYLSGETNENIVQNHLNIALLNVF